MRFAYIPQCVSCDPNTTTPHAAKPEWGHMSAENLSELGTLRSSLARVTRERDEAVALVRRYDASSAYTNAHRLALLVEIDDASASFLSSLPGSADDGGM